MQNAFVDEKNCLSLLADGNEKAFRYIFDAYHAKVYSYAYRYLKSKVVAQEVVQDVFLSLWTNRVSAKNIEDMDAYMHTLSKNRALTVLKKLAIEQKVLNSSKNEWSESRNTTEEMVAYNETYTMLTEALQVLPPRQRDIYTRCQLEGQRQQQVAEDLQISVNTVKAHLQQASATVKKYMSDHTGIIPFIFFIILSYWF